MASGAAGATGLVLLVSVVAIVAGVFVTVLSVVSLVKVLQIAEDLRYLRSKSDIHVQRPKSHTSTLVICLGVAVGVLFLLMVLFAGFGSALQNVAKIG